MAIKSTVELEVKSNVKGFKGELRQLTLEAQNAVKQFGEFSPQAVEAEKRVAQLKDRIDDFNDRIKAINPDKFAQVQTVVQGVARGFQAAQGAVALFGSESKDLEKTMIKLQGAMALADGLEGLGKIQQQFTAIAGSIKNNLVKAFSTLKGAIIATGLGALVVVLGLIITNFEQFKKVMENLFPGFNKMTKFIGGLIQGFTDWLGVTSAQDRALEKLNKTTEKSNEQLDREIALLQAQGDQLGVFSKQREKLGNDLAQARANYGKNSEKEWGKIILDTKNALQILDIEQGKYEQEQVKKQTDANAEAQKERNAETKKRVEDEIKRQQAIENARVTAQNQLISAELSANEAARQKRLAMATTDEERVQIEFENKLASLKEAQIQEEIAVANNQEALALIRQKYSDLELVAIAEVDKAELALQQKNVDAQLKIDTEAAAKQKDIDDKATADALKNQEALAMSKAQMVQATRDAVTALGSLFKEGSDAAKASALVDIAIGTGVGFINALDIAQKGAKATGPAAPFAFPIFYASQIAAVLSAANKARAIIKGGQGQASKPSTTSGVNVPQTNAPRLTSSTLQNGGDNLTSNTRVYVTEGDITRTQYRVSNLQKVSIVE
jgi:hypothetical protein